MGLSIPNIVAFVENFIWLSILSSGFYDRFIKILLDSLTDSSKKTIFPPAMDIVEKWKIPIKVLS
jgi:hypothetical protein